MKKTTKKVFCLLLAIGIIICALSGCSETTKGISQTYKESCDTIKQTAVDHVLATHHSYKEEKANEWQIVFTSFVDNEKLVISRRHDKGLLGAHSTMYFIELFEDDVCTYYHFDPFTVCPNIIWSRCSGQMASIDMTAESGGAMSDIYPYIQDVMSYMMLQEIQRGEVSSEELKMMLADDVFATVLNYQTEDIQSQLLGSAMGKILEVNDYVSMLNELYSGISDAVDAEEVTKDKETAAAYYLPATPALVNGFKTASFEVLSKQIDIDKFFSKMAASGQEDRNARLLEQRIAIAQKALHLKFKEIAIEI